MSDTNTQSASDRIVAQGREERASKLAQGLDPTEEIPKLSLTSKTQAETREQYLKRCDEHRIRSSFAESDSEK